MDATAAGMRAAKDRLSGNEELEKAVLEATELREEVKRLQETTQVGGQGPGQARPG